jgi:1-acyl-sn-glycerol-3-phosphate acyltransferase
MFVCDYNSLITPKPQKVEETKSFSTVLIEGADVDATRSFSEVYASSPEPKIPVCITYHWKIFRARTNTATLTVSDGDTAPFGQEQAFNFLEIQPYHE